MLQQDHLRILQVDTFAPPRPGAQNTRVERWRTKQGLWRKPSSRVLTSTAHAQPLTTKVSQHQIPTMDYLVDYVKRCSISEEAATPDVSNHICDTTLDQRARSKDHAVWVTETRCTETMIVAAFTKQQPEGNFPRNNHQPERGLLRSSARKRISCGATRRRRVATLHCCFDEHRKQRCEEASEPLGVCSFSRAGRRFA